jgi:hypothetical protein
MKLIEVEQPPSEVAVTQKFIDSYEAFSKAYPRVPSKMKKFCEVKLAGGRVGGKDEGMTGGSLSGYLHWHVVQGTCILIYKRDGAVLRLYDLVKHNAYEGKNTPTLARWLDKQTAQDFMTIDPDVFFDPKKHTVPALTNDQRKLIVDEIYYLAANGLNILNKAVLNDDWSFFMDWITEIDPSIDARSIFTAYNGPEPLKDMIRSIIRQMSVPEEIREAKRKKIRELNERSRLKKLTEPHQEPIRTVLVLHHGRLIDMPENIAKESGLPYFFG